MSIRALILAVAAILVAGPAAAVEVYINGVKVTGAIRQQTFEKVTLRFDEKGDLHVDAPGYRIETPSAAAPPAAAAPAPAAAAPAVAAPVAQDQYWLVINAENTGHYKIHVKANGAPVADVPASSPQYVADLTPKLQQGGNTIEVTFFPLPNAPVVPPADAVTVMVGMGQQSADGTLTIKKVLGTTKHPTGKKAAQAHAIKFSL